MFSGSIHPGQVGQFEWPWVEQFDWPSGLLGNVPAFSVGFLTGAGAPAPATIGAAFIVNLSTRLLWELGPARCSTTVQARFASGPLMRRFSYFSRSFARSMARANHPMPSRLSFSQRASLRRMLRVFALTSSGNSGLPRSRFGSFMLLM